MEKLTDSFVSAVENMCPKNKLHTIKQMPEEKGSAYILRFLSDAKLAYKAWAIGE